MDLGRGALITVGDIIEFNSSSLSIVGCLTSIVKFNG